MIQSQYMFGIFPAEIKKLRKVRYGLHWAHASLWVQYYKWHNTYLEAG